MVNKCKIKICIKTKELGLVEQHRTFTFGRCGPTEGTSCLRSGNVRPGTEKALLLCSQWPHLCYLHHRHVHVPPQLLHLFYDSKAQIFKGRLAQVGAGAITAAEVEESEL